MATYTDPTAPVDCRAQAPAAPRTQVPMTQFQTAQPGVPGGDLGTWRWAARRGIEGLLPREVPQAPAPTAAPTIGGGPAPGAPTGAGSGADPYAIIQQTIAGLPPTGASLDAVVAALRANGITAFRGTHGTRAHPQASDDAIVLADGTYVDLIQGVGSPGATWHSASHASGQYDPTRAVIGPDGQPVKLNDYL
jgi:hypothetical protein